MKKKKIFSIIMAGMLMSSMLSGCGEDNEKSTAKENEKTILSEADNSSEQKEEELIPNEASDFMWHEFTADEFPDGVGGICIDRYVGERTDIVIPKSINDKPVIAIASFAFCPYTEQELEYGADSVVSPENKLKELMIEQGVIQEITETSLDEDGEEFTYEYIAIDSDFVEPYVDDIEYLKEQYGVSENQLKYNKVVNNIDGLEYKIHTDFLLNNDISQIETIMIPATIKQFGRLPFGLCNKLEVIKVYGIEENEIPAINADGPTMYMCPNLKEVNFYTIDDNGSGSANSYKYCKNLKKACLYPNSEGMVDLDWLGDCEAVKTIYIAEGTNELSSLTMNLSDIEPNASFTDFDAVKNLKNPICEHEVSNIYLPASLQTIYNHNFCTHTIEETYNSTECEMYTDCTIIAPAGSYAESYAKENGIPCENP